MWNCIFPLVRCQLVYLTYAKQPDWFIVMNIIYLLKKFYSSSRWLCMSLMNLNYSLVYFKALHKKVNIFWCLYDCLAPPNGWLIFFSRDQLRFISYLNVYTRLNNNWFSRSGNCTKCGINYHKKNTSETYSSCKSIHNNKLSVLHEKGLLLWWLMRI